MRVGYSSAPVTFYKEMQHRHVRWPSLANQNGFQMNFPTLDGTALTAASNPPAPQSRNATALLIEDTMSWLKGAHNISIGGSWTQYKLWAKNSNLCATRQLWRGRGRSGAEPVHRRHRRGGVPRRDGREHHRRPEPLWVPHRTRQRRGRRRAAGREHQRVQLHGHEHAAGADAGGRFLSSQDSWRWKPNFTINVGLRYELQFPFYPLNSSYSTATLADLCGVSGVGSGDSLETKCNLFQPGNQPGKGPQFVNFAKGDVRV